MLFRSMLHQPRVQLPTCMGVRMESDRRWRDFLNAWVDYNRGIQQIREWLYAGLAINGEIGFELSKRDLSASAAASQLAPAYIENVPAKPKLHACASVWPTACFSMKRKDILSGSRRR